MSQPDLKTMAAQATDLKPADEAAAKLRAEQKAAEAQNAMEAFALAWNKSMRRTFKGIFPEWKRKMFVKGYDDEA